jgi:hypothetical protein
MTHTFDMRCGENGIEHRFTKINHRAAGCSSGGCARNPVLG